MTPSQLAAIREPAQRQASLGNVACYVTNDQVLALLTAYEEQSRVLGEIHAIACGAVYHHIDHALDKLRSDIDRICELAGQTHP